MDNYNVYGKVSCTIKDKEIQKKIYEAIGLNMKRVTFTMETPFSSEYIFDGIYEMENDNKLSNEFLTIKYSIFDKSDYQIKPKEVVIFKFNEDGTIDKIYKTGAVENINAGTIDKYNFNHLKNVMNEAIKINLYKEIIDIEKYANQLSSDNYSTVVKELYSKLTNLQNKLDGNLEDKIVHN